MTEYEPAAFAAQLAAEGAEFQTSVEQSLVFRSEMLVVARQIRARPDQPLTGRQLDTLRHGTAGYLRLRDRLYAVLQPGDILLEKTPFRLTDRFIPGHFGHVAIWIGDQEELHALGLWDDPLVQQHGKAISEGPARNIVEALRSGVQLNSLEHFLNVDDVAVLRPVTLSLEDKREALRLALRQVGKAYDFNFDVNTTEKIVCSELAYVSFPTITWPTEQTLGRHTISPDHVARLAFSGTPLRLVTFYHDGSRLPPESQLPLFKQLMPE